jgi:polysaccharide pyruvyl transferase WcaK-like protein
MPQLRRFLIAADIGGDDRRHIGDEAMLESNLAALRARVKPIDVTLVSRDPAASTARYGCRAVAPLTFSADPQASEERREALMAFVANAARRELPVVDALAEADALIISGGGNLSATWPDLLYERIGLIELARAFGKPVAVLGQTIGPQLRGDEAEQLGCALAYARFVGLRERPSLALAARLGVPTSAQWYQCDDSLFGPATSPVGGARIAVTVDPQLRASPLAFDAFVAQLRELLTQTGAALSLVPHAFGGAPSDDVEARIVAGRLGLSHDVVASGLDADGARAHTARAALVISTRYHPIVFALGAGVPALGIHADDYCRIKLRGALEHAGLARWSLDYDGVAHGELLPLALALWRRRDDVSRTIRAQHATWRRNEQVRWDTVMQRLGVAVPWHPLKAFAAWRRSRATSA